MITFSKLEKKGNLGNQLFQIASTIGLAKKHGHEFGFPKWKYNPYFKQKLPLVIDQDYSFLKEKFYHHHEWNIGEDNYDLGDWLQSENYFDVPYTKELFTFKDEFKRRIKNKYTDAFKKKTILLSIRRGDFVAHPDYYQLPIKYYINALMQHFPNWKNYNLVVLSDDIAYCKFHFGFLPNAFFGEGLNAIEQLCLGSLCNHFIISNSTFSWWSAWIGETKESKTITPIQNFRGQKALEMDDKNYFPKRWIAFNYLDHKINLDANLYIEENEFLNGIFKDYVLTYFKVNSINYIKRIPTKNLSSTNEINIFSTNNIMPPLVIYDAYNKLKSTCSKVVYNYNNILKINYSLSYNTFKESQDFGVFTSVFNNKKRTLLYGLIGFSQTDLNSKSSINIDIIGAFSKNSGYSYYLKTKKQKAVIYTKRSVKQILKK